MKALCVIVGSYSFQNVGQRSRSRSLDKELMVPSKGFVIRNTHVKNESPMSNGKKVMCKVEVFQM